MIPPPRENPHLFGHEAVEASLAAALSGTRMHHAWLITGPEGIGKATLAFRLARRLLAGADAVAGEGLFVPPTAPVFRRVAAGAHADLLTIEREWDDKRKKLRGEIRVDDVRRVAGFLHLTPAEGGWRVVVVDGAEDLNRNAENALLKVLEEPPPRAVLLLVCSAAGRLLPTIRSRCRRLRLAPIDDVAMARVLELALPETPAAERARVAAMAEGSPGRALALADGGGLAVAELVARVFDKLPDVGPRDAFAVADALGREEDAFTTFMDLLRARLADAVRAAARHDVVVPAMGQDGRDDVAGRLDPATARLVGARPLDAWVDVWHALTTLQAETEGLHLDKRQALLDGFALLADGT